MLAERRRLDLDRADEMWEGVLHMVPPPLDGHEALLDEIYGLLRPRALARGLLARGGTPGLYANDDSWRVPDQLYARPDQRRNDRFWGAELVVEIRSPGDESYEKLPFYATVGVTECLIVDRDTKVPELYRLGHDRVYAIDPSGQSRVLDVVLIASKRSLLVSIDAVTHTI